MVKPLSAPVAVLSKLFLLFTPHDGKSWLFCGIVGASWVILVEKWQSYWSRVVLVRVLYVIFVVASFVCRFEAWVLAIN